MYGSGELAVSAIIWALLAACTSAANEPVADPKLDETVFKTKVEPILVQHCSYNACHGNPNTALRIYAPGTLRATVFASIDDAKAPLTPDEEHANFLNAAAFSLSAADPADNFLLRKPLPSILGGYEHKGGAIFKSTNEARYAAIYCWLTGKTAC